MKELIILVLKEATEPYETLQKSGHFYNQNLVKCYKTNCNHFREVIRAGEVQLL